MRNIIVFLSCILLAICLSVASPIDRSRVLINRPTPEMMFGSRQRRAEPFKRIVRSAGRKGGQPIELNLRKGEYICGNRVCQLQPGEKPPCEMCQYPLALTPTRGIKY